MVMYLLTVLLAAPIVFEVPGLTCPTCVAPVKKTLALTDGVTAVRVDWRARRVEVEVEVGKVTEADLRARLESAGFPAKNEDSPVEPQASLDYLVVDTAPPKPSALAVWGKATIVALCTPSCAPCDTAKRDLKLFAQRASNVAVRILTIDLADNASAALLPKRADIPYLYVFDRQAKQLYAGGMGDGQVVYQAVESALGIKK